MPSDCLNCGMCEWCIDRSIAAAEEADGLSAGIDPDDDSPEVLLARCVIRQLSPGAGDGGADKWDRRLLSLAAFVGGWSKDPSTRVGAVVADGRRVVAVGFNGFPAGCDDAEHLYADRERKLRRVVHAEVNAVLSAGRPVRGLTVYTHPLPPCCRCAGLLIQAGIARVVAPAPPPALAERWGEELAEARRLFAEAGVILVELAEG